MKSPGSSKKLSRPPGKSKNYHQLLITWEGNEHYKKGIGLNDLDQQTGQI